MSKVKASKNKASQEDEAPKASGEPKYTVDDLVEASGLVSASVRVALRDLSIEKNFGNKYGWDSKKDFAEVVAALKERSDKRKDKRNDAPAPAPKAKAKGKPKAKAKAKK